MNTDNLNIAAFIAILAILWGLVTKGLRFLEMWQRGRADDVSSSLKKETNTKKGEADEIGKNADSAIDEYKRLKRKYDDETK